MNLYLLILVNITCALMVHGVSFYLKDMRPPRGTTFVAYSLIIVQLYHTMGAVEFPILSRVDIIIYDVLSVLPWIGIVERGDKKYIMVFFALNIPLTALLVA